MTSPLDPARLIATHIARHGVTRYPAAIVAPCSAELTPQDVAAHQARVPMQLRDGPRSCVTWQPRDEKRRGNRR